MKLAVRKTDSSPEFPYAVCDNLTNEVIAEGFTLQEARSIVLDCNHVLERLSTKVLVITALPTRGELRRTLQSTATAN